MAETSASPPTTATAVTESLSQKVDDVGHSTPATTESIIPAVESTKESVSVPPENGAAVDPIMADSNPTSQSSEQPGELVASVPTTATDPPMSVAKEPVETPVESAATSAVDPPVSVPKEVESTDATAATDVSAADAPDPDEDDLDDLDDLDDVLDEFAATKIDTSSAPTSSGPGRPADLSSSSKVIDAEAPVGDDEFAQELQKGMADLLGELESSPEMQKQFEDMIRELGKAQGGAPGEEPQIPGLPSLAGLPGMGSTGRGAKASTNASASASEAGKGDASFQETIRKTMERMQESGEAAGAAAATSANKEDDFMAALLKEMEAGGSEEDFSKMLLGMMEQLTNKEILYEPMKELDTKFPGWMKNNADKTPAADMRRYREQERLVKEIVAKFEEPGYSDENTQSREYILERMQKMQGEGSPPADLVGDMDVATEALGEMDAGCPTQ